MPGALLQLGAFGSASAYLHQDPEITFWKSAWRRTTPYAMESINMPMQGGPADFGRKTTATISKAADMANRAWLEIRLPDLADYYIAPLTATADQPLLLRAHYVRNGSGELVARLRIKAPVNAATNWAWYRIIDVDTGQQIGGDVERARDAASDTYLPHTDHDVLASHLNHDIKVLTVAVVAHDGGGTTSAQSQSRRVLALRWCNSIGHALLESVEWECGGSRIDIIRPDFMDAWSELTEKEEHREGFHAMIGKFDDYDIWDTSKCLERGDLYCPMLFSFCTSSGLSIPILALTYHDTRLNFAFRDALECVRCNVEVPQLISMTGHPISLTECTCWVDMVFLEVEERRRMSAMAHESLITQVQTVAETIVSPDDPGGTRRVVLDGLNHPVKELIWVYQPYNTYQRNAVDGNDWFNYELPEPHAAEDAFESVRLTLQGTERMAPRPGRYFRLVQPYQHHTRIPKKHVLCFNFGLQPELPTPTGACHFGRLESAALHVQLSPNIHPRGGKIKVWAIGYNIMRYAEGLGGLAFMSN
jgi:hypothetical protein